MYTIGQVSEMFHLPVSTLRYYDKEGLFPNLKRESGIRKFNDHELEALRMIECLKASGLEIKDIKQFFEWCNQGSSTYQNRKELFETRKKAVEQEILRLNKTLDMLKYMLVLRPGHERRKRRQDPPDAPGQPPERHPAAIRQRP